MLKNITNTINKKDEKGRDITVKYNQKTITTAPGENLDVRDFGVPAEHILAVEKHILSKNPNVFDVKKTKDVFKTSQAALKKVEDLEAENEKLKEELKAAQESGGDSSEVVEKLNAENDGLQKEVKSLKKQVGELKAKVKNLQ